MEEKSQVPVVNIANALTVLRLLLVPVLIWLLLDPTVERRWIAWLVFAVAAMTDQLDGYLARSRGLVTNFGKLADSIADKFLILSAMIMASLNDWLWWWVTIAFIVRELGITIMRMVVVKKKVMAAGRGGKIKMVAQVFGVGGLIVPWDAFLPSALATGIVWFFYVLIAIALFFALTSAWEYIREARSLDDEPPTEDSVTNDALDVARELVADLTRDGVTLAVAESLTGGLLAATIVSVPGTSMCFRGGVVTYMTDTKVSILGVSQDQLDATGPVDPNVAEQMARGVAELFKADIGISTTGVAGPGPADGHEAGTVVVGLYTPRGARSVVFHFDGNRVDVRSKSVSGALRWVSENLTNTRHF